MLWFFIRVAGVGIYHDALVHSGVSVSGVVLYGVMEGSSSGHWEGIVRRRWIAGKGIVRWRMVSGKLGLGIWVCEKVVGALVVRREGWLSVVGEGGYAYGCGYGYGSGYGGGASELNVLWQLLAPEFECECEYE